MGVWDGYMMFLHGTRGHLRYVTDSKVSWFMMAIDLGSCLVYSQMFLV